MGRVRAIASTDDGLNVWSRRGRNMSTRPSWRPSLPAMLDSELVAFDRDGSPDFPLICERMLMRPQSIAVVFVISTCLA